ncbi:MAG: hypothetical protein ACOZE5_04695 [Verrucomicrobiota bacterium]
MSATDPFSSGLPDFEPRARIMQPCAESCAAYRPLKTDGWSDYGRCANPRSRFCGYPVRLGRECRDFLVRGAADLNRAS